MAPFTYRLQLLLERKQEAKKAAENELARRQQERENEAEKLRSLQQRERQLIEKREQLRRDLLTTQDGEPLTAHEVKQRSEYIKVVGVQIEEARNEIHAQQTVLEKCDLRVQEAQKTLNEAKREVEILTKHRTRQEERFRREEQVKEELELDEVGNVLYTSRRQSS